MQHCWYELIEVIEQSTNGSGKIDPGRVGLVRARVGRAGRAAGIREPPPIDPGQLPALRNAAADEAGKIAKRSRNPAGRIGHDDQADHFDAGDEPGRPLPRSGLR